MRYCTFLAFFFSFFNAQAQQCPKYQTATGFYDGESIWWHEDAADQIFTGRTSFSFDATNLTFTLQTRVEVCHWAFEVVRGASPEQCPFQPYYWAWTWAEEGQHLLKVQFPATIAPCVPSLGSNAPPYNFRFKVQYRIAQKAVSAE
jgi:hypothetical protein